MSLQVVLDIAVVSYRASVHLEIVLVGIQDCLDPKRTNRISQNFQKPKGHCVPYVWGPGMKIHHGVGCCKACC